MSGIPTHRLSCCVQPVERVYTKLIMAKWLVTTVCARRDDGSTQGSRPLIESRRASRVQDAPNRGAEHIHWDVPLVERNTKKWTQKAASATPIMASALSGEGMLSLIKK